MTNIMPMVEAPVQPGIKRGFWVRLDMLVLTLVAMVWPVLNGIVSLDIFFQFLRMLWHWNMAGQHAGWIFMGHLAGATVLFYYVMVHGPARYRKR